MQMLCSIQRLPEGKEHSGLLGLCHIREESEGTSNSFDISRPR